jgi:signal transduction histidine kinase
MLDRLDDASRRQQRFVADASHELRTPLTRLRARLELERALLDRGDAAMPSPADREAALQDALEDTIALQRLADDLLALARGDSDVAVEPRTPIDLDDIVLREARRLRENGRVDVDSSAVSAAHVVGEPTGLTRVVRNLLENAERHARSHVTISLTESDAVAVLAVEDDGPGIAQDERELIFERFARTDGSRARDSGGMGLGLAIVRDIVARHEGSVSVDPDHSPGARFVVSLPTELS